MSEYLPLTITFPLPPATLAKNRMPGHPQAYGRVFRYWKGRLRLLIANQIQHVGDPPRLSVPLVADIIWRQCGSANQRADPGAVVARCEPAMDAAELAGLVENDRLIRPGWISIEQARSKRDEGVTMVFRLDTTKEAVA